MSKTIRNKKVFGVGVADIKTTGENLKAYTAWKSMISRCYSDKVQAYRPTYQGCSVCHEWTIFSEFKKWFDENYIYGYELDKDILNEGNKVYCPQYCCFVPPMLNSLISSKKRNKGSIIGTYYLGSGRYKSMIRKHGHQIYLGTFNSQAEAFRIYKLEKELYISQVALDYFNNSMIGYNVLKALLEYRVSP